jgi:hypothetical protein
MIVLTARDTPLSQGATILGWLLLIVIGVMGLPKLWRMSEEDAVRWVEWLDWVSPWSRNVLRGFVRSTVTGYILFVTFFMGRTICDRWGVRFPLPNAAYRAGTLIVVYGGLVTFVLGFTVIFFNRPGVLVAPALRKDVGVATRWIVLLREWWSREEL